ncbi:outer membrane lipoprotein carrier protein LolA [Paracoccaceae bacterium]|jgi:outer membrane lipoprotein-sorting protein|nr:outer membrane lipoprotein carrier protein LolA [Paracoccaceae bacterium]
MNPIRYVLLVLLLLTQFAPAFAEKISLRDLSAYLNGITTAEFEFSQINDDGSVSQGKIYIKRPGRMRFEYNPPNNALVLASAGRLAIFDDKGNQDPVIYPLKRTPLAIILAKNIDLASSPMVVGHEVERAVTVVSVEDPGHPDQGRVELVFIGPEPVLRQWVVRDASGGTTTMILGDFQTGMALGSSLFNITHNTNARRN